MFNLKKGKETFKVDEHPRNTTIEKLLALPSSFKKDGIGSSGNSSVIYFFCITFKKIKNYLFFFNIISNFFF